MGGGGGAEEGVALQVERECERWLLVTFESSSRAHGSGTLSGPLVSLSAQQSSSDTESVSYRVDLTTPEGEEAYDALMSFKVPAFSSAFQPAGDSSEQVERRGGVVNTPLVQVGGGQYERSRVDNRADGSRVESDEGGRDTLVQAWRWLQSMIPIGSGARGVLASTEFCPDDKELESRLSAITRSKGQDVQTTWHLLSELDGRPELMPADRDQ
ncbi:MAG: hypothetical protein EA397_09385, partial [Deltaproteobacteria bacterium]